MKNHKNIIILSYEIKQERVQESNTKPVNTKNFLLEEHQKEVFTLFNL